MSAELLIRQVKGWSFNDFVSDLLQLIRCDHWEQRQAENNPEEHFIRCSLLGVVITLSMVNDSRFAEYNFLVQFEPEIPHREAPLPFDGLCDAVARKLAANGYEVVRPLSREINSAAVHYRQNPEKDGRGWKQVVTQNIEGMPLPVVAA